MLISSMVPPEASACMLWGGMSSCAQHHSNNGLERLVLRSAPHVFRRGPYERVEQLALCERSGPISDTGMTWVVRFRNRLRHF